MKRTLFTIGGALLAYLVSTFLLGWFVLSWTEAQGMDPTLERNLVGSLSLICLIAGGVIGNLRGRSKREQPIGAGWFPDPSGRFIHRYWDEGIWTEHVERDGKQSLDPFNS